MADRYRAVAHLGGADAGLAGAHAFHEIHVVVVGGVETGCAVRESLGKQVRLARHDSAAAYEDPTCVSIELHAVLTLAASDQSHVVRVRVVDFKYGKCVVAV